MKSRYSRRLAQFAFIGCLAAGAVRNLSAQTVTSIVPDGKAHKFEARDHQFFIDGQPTLLVAGEMHFGRVLPEDWETRIQQARAMGLNTISLYLFWNQVEPKQGKFNFTGMTDVRRVLQLLPEERYMGDSASRPVLLRGDRIWRHSVVDVEYPNVPVRTTDATWLKWCRAYLSRVYQQVGDLQVSKGGPLLMVQIGTRIRHHQSHEQ